MAGSARTPSPPGRFRFRVPQLVSRQCGNLTVFVMDRTVYPPSRDDDSPTARGGASPHTPDFKPDRPPRLQPVILKPAQEVRKDCGQSADANSEKEIGLAGQAPIPQPVTVMEQTDAQGDVQMTPELESARDLDRQDEKAVGTAAEEPEQKDIPMELQEDVEKDLQHVVQKTEEKDVQKLAEQEKADPMSSTEISSASPCSSADDSGESSDETDDERGDAAVDPARFSGMPCVGFLPMPAGLFPTYRRRGWQYCHRWQLETLGAWYQNACHRAQLRGTPKADEPCCVGCCCRRCIGYPAAFRPPGILRTGDQEEDLAAPDAGQVDVDDSTSTESSTSDESSDHAEVVWRQPPSNSTWLAPTFPTRRRRFEGEEKDTEVYVGNLNSTRATADELQQAFEQRFRVLPAYQERYLAQGVSFSAVQKVALRGGGRYAFVSFLDPQLASTAMLFHGMEFCGEKIRVCRPREFVVAPDGMVPPMDVGLLRRIGMLPQEEADVPTKLPSPPPPPVSVPAPAPVLQGSTSKAAPMRPPTSIQGGTHLYVGNLPASEDTLQDVSELVTCISGALPAYNSQLGPAMLGAREAPGGGWLVEMQSAALAREAQDHLRLAKLKGNSITAYVTFGQLPLARAGA